eukprot:879817-Amphidinium_carterae.1
MSPSRWSSNFLLFPRGTSDKRAARKPKPPIPWMWRLFINSNLHLASWLRSHEEMMNFGTFGAGLRSKR